MQVSQMNDADEIMISLKPKYADHVFEGGKTVELRKRRLKVAPGTRVWIYATSPIAAIRGYANLACIETGSPSQIWRALGAQTGISKDEFEAYFNACKVAHALVLTDVMAMKNTLSLVEIRRAVNNFHPPQFYCHLNGSRSLMRLSSRKYEPVKN
jgi:predicted transcriptional regulator